MTKDLNYPDLQSICRLCLKEDQVLVEIFPNADKPAAKQLSIPMRIMACAALEVQSSDDLPKLICEECRYQLEKYFYFRKRAQLSDNKLRKHLRLLSVGKKSNVFKKTSMKSENDDDEDDEELEFADSIKFIKDQEEIRNEMQFLTIQQELRHHFNMELVKEQRNNDTLIDKKVAEHVSALMKEKELELRETLRNECMKEAQTAVRQEEMELLEEELHAYFSKRRQSLSDLSIQQDKPKTRSKDIDRSPAKSIEKKTYNLKLRSHRKRERSAGEITLKAPKTAKLANDGTDFVADEDIEYVDDNDENDGEGEIMTDIEINSSDTQSNFYILNKPRRDEPYVAMEGGSENYEGLDGDENPSTETAFYQIEDNGDIQNIENKDSFLFKVGQSEIDDVDELMYETCDLLEFVNVKASKSANKRTSVNQKSRANTDDCIRKLKSQPLVETDQDHNDNAKFDEHDDDSSSLKLPFSRPTDTPKTFKCQSCPMSFSTENTLNRHYRTHEQSEKRGVNFTCSECNVIFSCKSALTRHTVIHTGERPYKCDECGKSFVQREILKRHQQVHTKERPCQCPYCPRAYTQKVNLTQHINQHHSDTPKVKQHPCHLCNKRFNHASGLSRHLATHSGILYQCMECDKKFGDRSSIKRHIVMVHCKESPSEHIKECNTPEKGESTKDIESIDALEL